MSSMPRCEAASISTTSSEVPLAIATHAWQVPSGVALVPCRQLSALARIRASDVLPVPRGPAKRYACRTCPPSIAFVSVRTTASCPTTSEKVCGRYFRYSAVTPRFKQLRPAPGATRSRRRESGDRRARRRPPPKEGAHEGTHGSLVMCPAAHPPSRRLPREELASPAPARPPRGT